MKVYLLWLWRDVEHVEVDDSAHDAVAAQVELELVTPDLDQSEVRLKLVSCAAKIPAS